MMMQVVFGQKYNYNSNPLIVLNYMHYIATTREMHYMAWILMTLLFQCHKISLLCSTDIGHNHVHIHIHITYNILCSEALMNHLLKRLLSYNG